MVFTCFVDKIVYDILGFNYIEPINRTEYKILQSFATGKKKRP